MVPAKNHTVLDPITKRMVLVDKPEAEGGRFIVLFVVGKDGVDEGVALLLEDMIFYSNVLFVDELCRQKLHRMNQRPCTFFRKKNNRTKN